MEKEDYLETIYNLKLEFGVVRISDIAKTLDISKPSVTQMMQRLDKDGLVVYKPYFPMVLTIKGLKIAKKVAERHQVLAEFFTLLGIPMVIQRRDIHGIEHFLSPLTLKRLKSVLEFLKEKKFR